MTETEIDRFKEILSVKYAELSRAVRDRAGIAIERSADVVEEIQNASERELEILNLDRESVLLRNVRAALRRIDDGCYGICVCCDEEISPKRLAAVPWAPCCIRCQELADRRSVESPQAAFLGEELKEAA